MKAKEIYFFFPRWIWCLFFSLVRRQHWGISSCNLIKTIRLWLCLVCCWRAFRQTNDPRSSQLRGNGGTLFLKRFENPTPSTLQRQSSQEGKQGQVPSTQAHKGSLWTASAGAMGVSCPHNNGTAHSPQCVKSIQLCLGGCWHDRLGYCTAKTQVRN